MTLVTPLSPLIRQRNPVPTPRRLAVGFWRTPAIVPEALPKIPVALSWKPALLLCFFLLCQLPLSAAWWESPHDKWYLKDDWKAAQVNNFAPTIKLLSPATNGWIIIWGDQGVTLKVNNRPVMRHVDRGLIYDTNLSAFIRGATEVKLDCGRGRILAEGEIVDDQGRVYPFASGCDWPTPVAPGTKLAPAPKAYRPGESSGAFHSAHNGLLIRYNDEERGKADIAKALGRIQKLRDQSIFLLRRFRSAEDILNFSPDVLWRKAESDAAGPMTEAEKLLKEQAIPAQKEGNYRQAISFAAKAANLVGQAEGVINSARQIEEAERQLMHLQSCIELMSGIAADSAKLKTEARAPVLASAQKELGEGRKIIAAARHNAKSGDWLTVATQAWSSQEGLAYITAQLSKAWGSPIGKLDEFPEDRFGWLNAQGLLMNDPANWEFTTVNPAANWIDLRGMWSFHTDPPNKGEELGWHKLVPDKSPTDGWKSIMVPREWEREGVTEENEHAPWDCPYRLSDQRCEDKPYNGYAWYRREIIIPKSWAGQKVVLHIEKVSNWLRVFLNGKQIAEPRRDGGSYDLPSELVKPGETNIIAIQIYNHDNFGGIVAGPVSLSVDGVQTDVVVTPGPLSWTYETAVRATQGIERTTLFASQMSPFAVIASDQSTLHLWGWESKGYRASGSFQYVRRSDNAFVDSGGSEPNLVGSTLGAPWLVLPSSVGIGGLGLFFEQRPSTIAWTTNALGFRELTIVFPEKGFRVVVHRLDHEARPRPEIMSLLNKYSRVIPIACSELCALDKQQLEGKFFLKYNYLCIPSFAREQAEPVAPLPKLFSSVMYKHLIHRNPFGLQIGLPDSLAVFTNQLQIGWHFIHSAREAEVYSFRSNSSLLSYSARLVDKSKLLKGVGELFAKRQPDLNRRGGNTEQQMFDDWKSWGFDHCRYAFAWGADWDIPLQKRMGGPISDEPALWERMDYLVKQHTDRGIMAMLCYFFNEDSPQRDSKNLMRNSTRYWQMHPEVRTNCYELWRRIAQRYASYPEHLVAYDFFNEPAYMHRDDWNRIIKDLTKIVRSVDQKHLIVCEAGDGWSQPQWFHWVEPTGDTNTIYSFHHYGKHWGYNYDEYYPGYKSMPEKKMDVLLEAILFGLYHNVPMHCGEFGVSMISPGEDHLVWLNDYLALFERFGIGWNWWNWDGNGIYRTGLKAGDEVSPNLQVLQKWIARKQAWTK